MPLKNCSREQLMLIYLPVSALVLLVSYMLFQKAAGTMSIGWLNIVSWTFYYYLLLQAFLGINLAYVFNVYHYLMSRAAKRDLALAYWAVCYVMVVMPLSMLFVQRAFFGGKIRAKLYTYFNSSLRPLQSRRDSGLVIFWGVMSFIAALSTAYVYFSIDRPPFITLMLSGLSPADFAQSRIDAKLEFAGNLYVRNILSLLLAPFVSYVAYGYRQLYPKAWLYRLWFYFTFAVAVLAVTYSGEKAPILYYFLTLFFISGFIRGRFPTRSIVRGFLFILTLVLLLYVVVMGGLAFSVNRGPIGRIVMTSVAGLPLHFSVFPDIVPFLRGGSFPEWMADLIFGVEHARSARVVMEVINPVGVQEGTAGVINTLFIAEAWANFGWAGFLISPLIVGFVIQALHNGLLSLPKTPMFTALMGYFMLGLGITGGFVNFIWNVTWLILFIWIVASLFTRRFLLSLNPGLYQVQGAEGG